MIIVGSIIFQIGLLALSLALDRFGAVSIFVVIWILRGSLVLGCAVAVFLLSSIILTRSPSPPPQSTVAIDPLQELRDLRRGFDMLSRAAEHGGGKAVAETTNALPNKPSQRQLVHLECMQNIREIDREIYKLTRATDYADYSIYGWMFRIDFRLGLFVSLALTGIATLFLLLSPLPLAA
jgi:hypothetical protein